MLLLQPVSTASKGQRTETAREFLAKSRASWPVFGEPQLFFPSCNSSGVFM